MPEEETTHGKEDPGPLPELPPFNPDFELIGYVERGQRPPAEQREAADLEGAVPLPLPEDVQEA
jgi:hypothetical protein